MSTSRAVRAWNAPLRAPVKVTTDSTGRVTVSWTTTTDRDDRMLTYTLYRNRETIPLLTPTRERGGRVVTETRMVYCPPRQPCRN